MERQPPIPCVHCLDIHSCGEFMRFPVQCVHTDGGPCQFCRDSGKSCVKVPERLTHLAMLLNQLLRLSSQESSANRCPILRENIRVIRRDFIRHVSVDPADFEGEDEEQLELDPDDQEFVTASLQEAARVAIEEFEEVQLILRQILPSLNSLSDYFLRTAETLHDTSRRLTTAVVRNYLLYRRHDG